MIDPARMEFSWRSEPLHPWPGLAGARERYTGRKHQTLPINSKANLIINLSMIHKMILFTIWKL